MAKFSEFNGVSRIMGVRILSVSDAFAPRRLSATERCFFLHDDYAELVRLRDHSKLPIEACGALFHDVLQRETPSILLAFSELIRRNEPETIWQTSLASRNVISDPIVRNLCYLLCAVELARESDSDLVFIVASPALGLTLSRLFETNEKGLWVRRSRFRRLALYAKVILRTTGFLASALSSRLKCRSIEANEPKSGDGRRFVLMRTWITKGSLYQDASKKWRFKDRNFGELSAFLEQKGFTPVFLPMFFNMDVGEIESLRRLAATEKCILIPARNVGLKDLLDCFVSALTGATLSFNGLFLNGIDVSDLFLESHLRTHSSPSLLNLNLCSAILKRVAARGLRFESILYPMENNPAEKPFILAARRWHPKTKIVGFQHSVWYREQLSMILSPEEVRIHPLPDEILCSGRRYVSELAQLGFPVEKLKVGANLRFPEINFIQPRTSRESNRRKRNVFVVLTYNQNHTYEFIDRLSHAFEELQSLNSDVGLWIKLHPLLDETQVRAALVKSGLPYEIVDGTVNEWTSKADAVAMVGSSVSTFEVMVAAVPFVRMSLTNDFDLECVFDPLEVGRFARSTAELAADLRTILTSGQSLDPELVEVARRTREEYFEPITEKSLSAFLPSTKDEV